jgi:TIR domain
MARIFLSYRRDDAQGEAGHLVAELRQRYGAASVFMDISAIEPGADFPQTIQRAMLGCEVVLVLIGKGWLDARDAHGRQRLDDPKDWVRLEVEQALEGKRRVIPVRVQGAQMPAEEALPDSMRPLTRLNAHEISAGRWDYDFHTLARLLDRLLPDIAPARAADDSKPPIRSSR